MFTMMAMYEKIADLEIESSMVRQTMNRTPIVIPWVSEVFPPLLRTTVRERQVLSTHGKA